MHAFMPSSLITYSLLAIRVRLQGYPSKCCSLEGGPTPDNSPSTLAKIIDTLLESLNAIYTASAAEAAVVACLLLFQAMDELLRMKIYPVIDCFVSLHHYQNRHVQNK